LIQAGGGSRIIALGDKVIAGTPGSRAVRHSHKETP
jgi:hypothetical protein